MDKRIGKGRNSKRLVGTAERCVYIGLDVHKATIHAALRRAGMEVKTWVMPSQPAAVVALLERFGAVLAKIVYEGGPTGFGLARALRAAGLPTEVVAPGKTPRPANPGSKSDRLDCRQLAEFAEKGLLKVVAVPTETEDQDRQVVRLRAQVVKKFARVKQQIKSLLLYHGIAEPQGLANWKLRAVVALRSLEVLPGVRLSLDRLLDEFDHLRNQLKQVEREMWRLAQQERHRDRQRRLRTHPGVGWKTAMTFLTEVYRPERFAQAEELTSYVGLAPRVSQSGQTRREGRLMKAGRGKLRAMLIEASWRWTRDDLRALQTFRRLVRNTGSGQKAIVGLARRMAVNLWCMLVRGEDYRPDYVSVP